MGGICMTMSNSDEQPPQSQPLRLRDLLPPILASCLVREQLTGLYSWRRTLGMKTPLTNGAWVIRLADLRAMFLAPGQQLTDATLGGWLAPSAVQMKSPMAFALRALIGSLSMSMPADFDVSTSARVCIHADMDLLDGWQFAYWVRARNHSFGELPLSTLADDVAMQWPLARSSVEAIVCVPCKDASQLAVCAKGCGTPTGTCSWI